MSTLEDAPAETSEELGRESDAVRRRLLEHVDQLKDRSRGLTDLAGTVKTQAKRHAPVLVGIGAVAILALGVLAVRARVRRQSRDRRDAILYAATRLLGPGYQVRATQPAPAFVIGAKQVGKQLLSAAWQALGSRAIAELRLGAAPTPIVTKSKERRSPKHPRQERRPGGTPVV